MLKLYLHPFEARTLQDVITRAHLGPLPGGVILGGIAVFLLFLLLIALVAQGLHDASGEVLPKYDVEDFLGDLWPGRGESGTPDTASAWSRLSYRKRRRPQVLALVVAADPQKIAARIISELRRGATALHGRGMYLQQERDILLVALTVTEIEHLKALVREEDDHAFITIIPANEVVGEGFVSLGKN